MSPKNLQDRPYFWTSLAVIALFLPVIFRLPAFGDLFVHAATLERLQADFWNPRDPMVDEPGLGNPYFSPYMVFWASVAKMTGLGTFTMLRIAAMANLGIFLIGFGLFVRTLTGSRWAPVYALSASFFLWGLKDPNWSGFFSLPSLMATIAYPSTFAMGLGMVLWAVLHQLVTRDLDGWRKWGGLGVIAVGGALVLMTHQFTAVGVAIYAGIYLTRRHRSISRRTWWGFAVVIVTVVLLVRFWPWFNLFDSTGGVASFNEVHARLYQDLFERYVLLVLAVPALILRLRSDRADPLALTAITCLVVFVFGGLSGNFFLARIFPIVALLSQVAVGIAVAEGLERGRPWRLKTYSVVCLTAMAAGLLFQSGSITLAFPGSYPAALEQRFGSPKPMGSYRWITKYVEPGESVMTTNRDALMMAPAYGVFTIKPAWPDPFLGDAESRRIEDTREFFDAGTSSTRRGQIMRTYDAHWVLAGTKDAELLAKDHRFALVAARQATPGRDMSEGTQQLFKYVGAK